MLIDSEELKGSLRRMKFPVKDVKDVADVITKSFNRGIDTALKIVEIYEDTEKLIHKIEEGK